MTDVTKDLERLHERILAADADTRYLFQPRLGELIDTLDGQGIQVPAGIRALNDELLAEAIEAQFDNMPV